MKQAGNASAPLPLLPCAHADQIPQVAHHPQALAGPARGGAGADGHSAVPHTAAVHDTCHLQLHEPHAHGGWG